jgi:hypothetical protein
MSSSTRLPKDAAAAAAAAAAAGAGQVREDAYGTMLRNIGMPMVRCDCCDLPLANNMISA